MSSPVTAFSPRTRWVAVAIVSLGLALHAGALRYGFVWDDPQTLAGLQAAGCVESLVGCLRSPLSSYFRPVFTASFAPALSWWSEPQRMATELHLENLTLFVVACLLAFRLARRTLKSEAAVLLALTFFALHPVLGFGADWITGRADLLALVFSLGALLWMLRAIEETRGAVALAVSAVLLGLSLFSKEQALLLGALAFVLPGPPAPRRRAIMAAVLLTVALGCFAVGRAYVRDDVPQGLWSTGLHLDLVLRTVAFYGRALLLPTPDALFQVTLGSWDSTPWPVVGAGVLVLVGVFAVTFLARAHPATRLFSGWLVVALIPVLNVVPSPSFPVGAYRAIVPLLGAAGLVGVGVDTLVARWTAAGVNAEKTRLLVAVGAAVGVAFCGLTFITARAFETTDAVFEMVSLADPHAVFQRSNLINDRVDRGETAGALEEYDRAGEELFGAPMTKQTWEQKLDDAGLERRVLSTGGLSYRRTWKAQVARFLFARAEICERLGDLTCAVDTIRAGLRYAPEATSQQERLDRLLRAAP